MQPSGFRVEGRAAGRAAKLVQLWPSLAQVEQCGTSIIRVRARRGRRRWAEDRWSSRRNGGQSGRTAGRREAVLHPAGWRRKRLSRQKGGGGRYCPPRRRRQSGEIDLGPAGRDCRIQPLRLDEIAPFALGGSSDIIARPGHRDTRAIPAKARAGAKAVEVLERALPGEMRIGDASTSCVAIAAVLASGWLEHSQTSANQGCRHWSTEEGQFPHSSARAVAGEAGASAATSAGAGASTTTSSAAAVLPASSRGQGWDCL